MTRDIYGFESRFNSAIRKIKEGELTKRNKELGITSHTPIRNRLKVLNNTPPQTTDERPLES